MAKGQSSPPNTGTSSADAPPVQARAVRLRLISTFGVLLALTAAEAQYFGRNKVEYVDFGFPGARDRAFRHLSLRARGSRANRGAARRTLVRAFCRLLAHEFIERQPLVLYGSQPEFVQTNVVSGLLSDTVGGVTESSKRRIVMPFAPTLGETTGSSAMSSSTRSSSTSAAARRMGQPLWFIEGMAEYLARGPMTRRPACGSAMRSEPNACLSANVMRHVVCRRISTDMRSGCTSRAASAIEVDRARPEAGKQRKLRDRMRHATGLDLDAAFADWRAAAVAAYGGDAGPSSETVTPQWAARTAFGRMQLGPAVSPDGRQAVFFSERDRLSLDLFLGDLASGQYHSQACDDDGQRTFRQPAAAAIGR